MIVVDDGSKDGTTQVALKWAAKLGQDKFRVLTLVKNRGKGGAVRLVSSSTFCFPFLWATRDIALECCGHCN